MPRRSAWPTETRPTTRPSSGSIWTTVPSALLVHEHRPIRRAQANEPSAHRGHLSHCSRVRVDAPDLSSLVRDPDSLLPPPSTRGPSRWAPRSWLCSWAARCAGPARRSSPPRLPPCRPVRRYLADVDDRGGLVCRRVDAEHKVATRGDPDGVVIGVDRVGRVPDEFVRAPQVDRLDDGVGAGSMRETVPSLPLTTQTASVPTARSIAGPRFRSS